MTNGDPANGKGNDFQIGEQGEHYEYSAAVGYDNFSYATGQKKKPLLKKPVFKKKKTGVVANFRKNQAIRQKQKAADSANTKLAIKAMAAKPQQKLVLPPLPKEDKGMNKGLKIGLWVAGGLVLLIGGYIAYKKFGKK